MGPWPRLACWREVPGDLRAVLTCSSVHSRAASKPRPAELSRMTAAQRLQLL